MEVETAASTKSIQCLRTMEVSRVAINIHDVDLMHCSMASDGAFGWNNNANII